MIVERAGLGVDALDLISLSFGVVIFGMLSLVDPFDSSRYVGSKWYLWV